ncbi:MAG: hypothetical protein JSR44_13375 [Spirochaetes bacterium]|nr:hypothetical protein [Spirochaetota bacterium]
MRRTQVALLLCASGFFVGHSKIIGSTAAFNAQFKQGFALEQNWRVRDADFSKMVRLDANLLTEQSAITAVAAADRLLIGTSDRGVFESADAGKSWQHFDVQRVPMRNDAANQRRVYAVDTNARFLTQKHDILMRTENREAAWQAVKSDAGRSSIYTAIHRGKNQLYLGTSVSGLKVAPIGAAAYAKALGGKAPLHLKFKSANAGLPGKPHDKSHFIFEEVTALFELADGALLVATGPKPELYLRNKNGERLQKIAIEKLSDTYDECRTLSAASTEKIVLSCNRGIWSGALGNPIWSFTPHSAIKSDIADYAAYALVDSDGNRLAYLAPKSNLTAEKKQRMANAAGQRVLYASAFSWHKRQSIVLGELKHDFWTALVIDGKDDNGIIRYDSTIALAKQIGAVRPLYKMHDVAEKVHALGKRLIVRLVIFKDPKLFAHADFAIQDAGGGKWVGTPKERWIDPYNPHLLAEYYAPMMRELTAKGVDEIQLDYIRFPSDGAVGRCRFPYKEFDYYYSEALANFLMGLRAETPLPMSADVYGYNGMYRAPGAIGQDLEVYGRVLDVISPMHYSSHFGDEYMRELPRDERAYELLLLALKRGTFFARGEFLLRPYIQAFSMKNGLWGYGKKYFADQIRGTADGGGNGFLFWGKLDDMTLVRKTQTEGKQ